MSKRARTTMLKKLTTNQRLADKMALNISIIQEYQENKENHHALKVISFVESKYTETKLFNKDFFDFLDELESGKLDKMLTQDFTNGDALSYYENLMKKGLQDNFQIVSILIQNELPLHQGIKKYCTGFQQVDDVVVIEFGNHKVTLLQYDTKIRLHSIHHKQKHRTKLFENYSFESADEAFTYFNNIDEYSEFNADVLEMVRF